jgi:hypothetical protein
MEEPSERDPSELSGYLGAATMVVLLALAAEHLAEGQILTAMVLAAIGIICFYVGAEQLLRELERGDGPPATR